MNYQKVNSLLTYFKSEYDANKIYYQQFISANYLLQIIHLTFPKVIGPLSSLEDSILILSWQKNKEYLKIFIHQDGQFSWACYLDSPSNSIGHFGCKQHYMEKEKHLFPWPVIWADEDQKKYFDYFQEKEKI